VAPGYRFEVLGSLLESPEVYPVARFGDEEAPLIDQPLESGVAEALVAQSVGQAQKSPGDAGDAMGESGQWFGRRRADPAEAGRLCGLGLREKPFTAAAGAGEELILARLAM
jgi:hypothetical protein